MCTLTYLPLHNGGFIFTTNRDEIRERLALPPDYYKHEDQKLLYARDIKSSGTWFAVNGKDTAACLLNGAFERYNPKSNYRISRGIVTIDFFKYDDAKEFIRDYNFFGIEPFTLVAVKHAESLELHEIRWDEHSVHYRLIPSDKPQMWSSTNLYDVETRKKKQRWFDKWLQQKPEITHEAVFNFHKNGGGRDFDSITNREGRVITVSITSVLWEKGFCTIIYEDLLNGKKYTKPIIKC